MSNRKEAIERRLEEIENEIIELEEAIEENICILYHGRLDHRRLGRDGKMVRKPFKVTYGDEELTSHIEEVSELASFVSSWAYSIKELMQEQELIEDNPDMWRCDEDVCVCEACQ